MGKRHQARELALKSLFQLETSTDDADEVLHYQAAEAGVTSDVEAFARELVHGVIDNRDKLDALLSGASDNWNADIGVGVGVEDVVGDPTGAAPARASSR